MRSITAAVLLLLLFLPALSAQDREYQIKAEFLERFTRFIEWPPDSASEFTICIIGEDPFGPYLNAVASAVKIQKKQIVLRKISSTKEIPDCNLLFVSSSEKSNLPAILALTRSKPILTVADSPGFGEKGVLINFFRSDGYVRFEINRDAVEESGLRFSSRLLKLGRLIGNDKTHQTP